MEVEPDDMAHVSEEDFIFSEYAIDDTLDPLNRLVKYHQTDFSLQRLVLVRELCDTARFAGFFETAKVIVPLLSQFTSDAEPAVRQTLVQQLYPLADFFVGEGGEAGYELLLSTLLPMAFELLVDKNVEVGTEALQCIKEIANFVRPEHVQLHLLNVVMTLAHDERAEDYRVVAAQLFNDLAPIFGKDFCMSVVLPELELLSNDSSFTVRKTVGGNLGGLCGVIKEDAALEVLVALYLNLCRDDIWGVRQACAESVEDMALALPPYVRVRHIVPAFHRLLGDNSRWVRNRAHEYLGRLLHTLASDDIGPALLQLYTDMAFQSESGDAELSEFCAFSFPAVVQVIGKERWGEVRDAYGTMLKDAQWKVRKSLAYSLHELALMLGPQLSEENLVPAFELLLRDLDDIRLGVVLHADQFLGAVSHETRSYLVPLLCLVPLESENWRLRNVVAQRIGDVATLLSPSSPAFASVVALVLRLLDDSVMEVRASTYKPAAVILKHLAHSGEVTLDSYLQAIIKLAERPSFQGRQMFAYVTEKTAEVGADDVVENTLLDGLLRLANDKVNNVRLVVERVMQKTFIPHPKWPQNSKVKAIMQALEAQKHDENTKSTTHHDGQRPTAGGSTAPVMA